jgi:phosphate transport system substrate-binding protein
MSSRRIVPEEARALRAAGAGNMIDPSQENIVAVDSLVVIVHPNNPVESLTFDQLARIYAGEITNWAEVGGADVTIAVIAAGESTGSRRVFENSISADGVFDLTDQAEIIASNTETASRVNAQENAIGYVSYAFQRGAKPMVLINECGIPTVPDAFSARTEEYALQQRLYLYTRADETNAGAQGLINFALSEEADNLIAKAGFIDLGVVARSQPEDGTRATLLKSTNADSYEASIISEMLEVMQGHDRLSTTFRFSTGSSRLNERGQMDMIRLANYLENQPAGTKVQFVGFTDSVGAFDANRDLSLERAELALNKFTSFVSNRLEGIEFSHTGFGEIAPVGCNITDAGRRTNRRVEVWIIPPA